MATQKICINGWNEMGMPINTIMRAFTASRSTISLFTLERVRICSDAWRSITQPLKDKKHENTASWRKHSAKVTPSTLMCFMTQRRAMRLPSKKRSEKKRANISGQIVLPWTHRYPKPTTGETMKSMNWQVRSLYPRFYSSKYRKSK